MYKEKGEKWYKENVPRKKTWDPVDKLIFSPEDFSTMGEDKSSKLLLNAIKYAFNYHYKRSPFYGRYCKENQISPQSIKMFKDLKKIPLMPDRFFKDYPDPNNNPKRFLKWVEMITPWVPSLPQIPENIDDIVSELSDYGLYLLFSSGTSGVLSFVPYDKTTLKRRILGSLYREIKSSYNTVLDEGNACITDAIRISFIPRPGKSCMGGLKSLVFLDEISDEVLWNGSLSITPTTIKNLFGNEKLKYLFKEKQATYISKVIDKLFELDQKRDVGTRLGIVGTPTIIYDLLIKMEKEGISVDIPNTRVTLISGWGGVSPTKLKDKAENVLGVSEDRCICTYGMNECSTAARSCGIHHDGRIYYHIPPTLQAYVRDEEGNLYEEGEGRFAFIDPLPTSYPGFIVTGDMVEILRECPDCACGLKGPVITNIRRAPTEDIKGCNIILEKI